MEQKFFNHDLLVERIIGGTDQDKINNFLDRFTQPKKDPLTEITVKNWIKYRKTPLKSYKNLNECFVCCSCNECSKKSREYIDYKSDCTKALIPLPISDLINYVVATSNAYRFNGEKLTDNAKKVFMLLITDADLGVPGKPSSSKTIVNAGKRYGFNKRGIEEGLTQLCKTELVEKLDGEYKLSYNNCRKFLKSRTNQLQNT